MSIAMTSFASLPSISIDVTSTRLISSAAPVSDATRAALLPSTRSLWFQLLPICGDAVALPPLTTHTVAGAVGWTVDSAAGVVCAATVAVGAVEAAPLVAVVVGVADAAASGEVDVDALASELGGVVLVCVVADGAAAVVDGGLVLATRRKPCVYVAVSVVAVSVVAVSVVAGDVAVGVAASMSAASVVASVAVPSAVGS